MLPARHSSTQVSGVITITGLADHDQPDWLITMTGIRTLMECFGLMLEQQPLFTKILGTI